VSQEVDGFGTPQRLDNVNVLASKNPQTIRGVIKAGKNVPRAEQGKGAYAIPVSLFLTLVLV
jgi:hypothetical protein